MSGTQVLNGAKYGVRAKAVVSDGVSNEAGWCCRCVRDVPW